MSIGGVSEKRRSEGVGGTDIREGTEEWRNRGTEESEERRQKVRTEGTKSKGTKVGVRRNDDWRGSEDLEMTVHDNVFLSFDYYLIPFLLSGVHFFHSLSYKST